MSLASELKSTVEAVQSAVPAPIFAAIGQSIADLDASGTARRAKTVGNAIILPTLTDPHGEPVDLAREAEHGPVVLVFYRGGWCPYCNVALNAFSRRLDQFQARGASLVAITPELPAKAIDTSTKNELGFPVLIDSGNAFARDLGLVFALPSHLRPLYRQIGIDLETWNGDNSHELPLAATYIVDATGEIRWAFVEADFTTRAEPDDVLAALARVS